MTSTQQAIKMVSEGTRNWHDDCLRFAKKWIRGKKKFTSERLIAAFELKHNFKPAEKRVWGSIMVRLANEGRIKKVGVGKYQNPIGHSKPVNVWSAL